MTEFVFNTLESVGFAHPLHPALTHIPMGMVMGCFFFGLAALFFKNTIYLKTALHCSVVGIIFILPTIIVGVLDWQHFYGATLGPLIIIKMVLAAILTLLLGFSIRLNLKGAGAKQLFGVYCLCLLCAIGLGFSGGELVYGG